MTGLALLAFVALLAQDREERLREAARRSDLEKVRALLEEGVPVDAKNRYGATALFFAADKGDLPMVRLLVERGARTDVKDTFYGMTPLARALSNEHQETALFLLQAALDAKTVSRGDYDDMLAEARRRSWTEAVSLLESAERPPPDPEIRLSEEEISRLRGVYRDPEKNAVMSLEVREGALVLVRGGEAVRLRPTGERELAFETGDGELRYWGRGGMVEGVFVQEGSETAAFRPMEEGESAEAVESVPADLPSGAPTPSGDPSRPAPWPSFRGPNGSGIADGQRIPLEWDATAGKNVRFATELPGFSVSSPILWENRIFVLTAVSGSGDRTFRTGLYGDVAPVEDLSEHRWVLYALDTAEGRVIWERELHRGTPGTKRHTKSSQANATPATDGKRVVSLLGSTGYLYCHDFEGNLLWKTELGVLNAGWFYDPDYQWGHSSSPILHEGKVIVQADVHNGPFVAAYDLETGKEVWRTSREGEIPTFSTPAVFRGGRGDELVTNGTLIRGYDPETGELLWHLGPNSELPVGSPVVSRDLIYVTAGYPPIRPIYAIRPGSRGDLALPEGVERSEALAWSKDRGGTYIPTPLVYRGRFFTNDNNGRLVAYDAATGELLYRARIGGTGGSYVASPIAADGRLYFTNEEGETYVVEAGSEYRLLAHNRVEGVVLSTPAASNGLLVIRTLERVYGIAEP